MIVPEILLTALWVFIVGGLLYAGVTGMRGRAIWLPNRSGIGGVTVKGTAARILGAVLVALAILIVYFTFRRVSR